LFYEGRVYTLNNAGVLICASIEEGKILWQERLKGAHSATPVAADGKVYVVSEKGVVTVVKSSDTAEVLATNDLSDGKEMLATPAIADGCIYFRSENRLYCVGPKKK
jgi:outer membrane protein assembly factor BamB